MKTKAAKHSLFFALAIALIGCSTVEPRLPVGLYREHSGPNFIDVSTNAVRVHIEAQDHYRDKNGKGVVFEYVLDSVGRLSLVVTRSAELLYGYPALEYLWDGEKIIAKDFRSGRRWEFVKWTEVGSCLSILEMLDGSARRTALESGGMPSGKRE